MTYIDNPKIAGTYFYKIVDIVGNESDIASATTTEDDLNGITKYTYNDNSPALDSLTTYYYKVYSTGGE